MNKIILDSPEYTIVTTDNKVYIIGNDENSYSIIPKGLVDEMAKNLGLYDRYNNVIKELNDKIEMCNSIINERNSIIRNLKRNGKKSNDKGSKDNISDIKRDLIKGENLVITTTNIEEFECDSCAVHSECMLIFGHNHPNIYFDDSAYNLVQMCTQGVGIKQNIQFVNKS